MKKMISIILMAAVLFGLCILGGCDTNSSGSEAEPPIDSSGSESTEEQPPKEEPPREPEPEPEPEPLSYEEYFSVERSFDWLGSIGAYTLKDLGHVTTAQTVPKEDGYIYFIRDYTEIVRVDEEGKNEAIIYESDPSIILDQIYADGPVMFFREGDAIMRMYLPDKTVDRLMVVPDFPAMTPDEARADVERFGSAYYAPQNWYRPLSTTDFMWQHPNTIYYEYEGEGPQQDTTFAFSALTDENYLLDYWVLDPDTHIGGFFDKYEIFYEDVRITSWKMLEDEFLFKRENRYPVLNPGTFATYSQYLKERGADLEAMGEDPHEVSLFRYPEDDFYVLLWWLDEED